MKKLYFFTFLLIMQWNMLYSEFPKLDYSGLKNFAALSIPLLKGVVGGYSIAATGTIVHELGHALTAKALLGLPVDIYLGAPQPNAANNKNPLINLWGIKVFKYNLWNYYNFANTPTSLTSLGSKNALVALGGPLAGIGFSTLLLTLFSTDDLKCTNPIVLFFIYGALKKQLNNLMPYRNPACYNPNKKIDTDISDGYKLLDGFGYTNRKVNIFARKQGWPLYVKSVLEAGLTSFIMHQLYMKRTFESSDTLLYSGLLAGTHALYQLSKKLDIF